MSRRRSAAPPAPPAPISSDAADVIGARRHQRRRCGNGERNNRSGRTPASVVPLVAPLFRRCAAAATGTDGAGKALSAVAIGGSPKDQRVDHGCILHRRPAIP